MKTAHICLIFLLQWISVQSKSQTCEFTCLGDENEQICVEKTMICDHFPDCVNAEDEEDCGCKGFLCQNGQCLDFSQKCDGHVNCFDNSDELNCTKSEYRAKRPDVAEKDLCLRPCKYRGSCVFLPNGESTCDCFNKFTGPLCEQSTFGENLKEASAHEKLLLSLSFLCDNGDRIRSNQRCNGYFDCSDFSDETNCTKKDYQEAQPNTADDSICLMKCERGTCEFNNLNQAYCSCSERFYGKFCESMHEDQPAVQANKINKKNINQNVSPTTAATTLLVIENLKPNSETNEHDSERITPTVTPNYTKGPLVCAVALFCIVVIVWLFLKMGKNSQKDSPLV